MSKSLLFVINGFGMGNATRCESLMDILQDDYRIDVITSDRAYSYFKGNSKVRNLFSQADLNLKEKQDFGSFRYYLRYVPHFFKRLFKNYRFQKKILAENTYEHIIFDSDYAFILHALGKHRSRLVAVNNAFEVVSYLLRHPRQIRPDLLASFFLESLDLGAHLLFCRWVLCPCLGYEFGGTQKSRFKKLLLLPPLVRRALLKPAAVLPRQVLVMESSSNVNSGLNLTFKNAGSYDFVSGDFKLNNLQWLAESAFVICNSGQSSISECLYLNKKTMISAIPRHAEQHVNSLIAQKKGFVSLDPQNFEQAIPALTDINYRCSYEFTTNEIARSFSQIRGDAT